MAKRDSLYSNRTLLYSSLPYMDIEWLNGLKKLPHEDVILPEGFLINPDETEGNSISGPLVDRAIDLFREMLNPPFTEEIIESARRGN